VIGQQFVKGRQLKGQSNVEFQDAAEAAEIDATDALDKERVPRIYRKAVRNYFDRLGDRTKSSGDDKSKTAGDDKNKPAEGAEGKPEGSDEKKPAEGDGAGPAGEDEAAPQDARGSADVEAQPGS